MALPTLSDTPLTRKVRKKALKKQRDHVPPNRVPAWSDREAVAAIYAARHWLNLASRTFDLGLVFSVDHIIPLRGRDVSGLHVASNLRIITHEENTRKGVSWSPDDLEL